MVNGWYNLLQRQNKKKNKNHLYGKAIGNARSLYSVYNTGLQLSRCQIFPK